MQPLPFAATTNGALKANGEKDANSGTVATVTSVAPSLRVPGSMPTVHRCNSHQQHDSSSDGHGHSHKSMSNHTRASHSLWGADFAMRHIVLFVTLLLSYGYFTTMYYCIYSFPFSISRGRLCVRFLGCSLFPRCCQCMSPWRTSKL